MRSPYLSRTSIISLILEMWISQQTRLLQRAVAMTRFLLTDKIPSKLCSRNTCTQTERLAKRLFVHFFSFLSKIKRCPAMKKITEDKDIATFPNIFCTSQLYFSTIFSVVQLHARRVLPFDNQSTSQSHYQLSISITITSYLIPPLQSYSFFFFSIQLI